MNDLKLLTLTELIDLLSTQTENYVAMLRNGITGDQYDQCKAGIKTTAGSGIAKNDAAMILISS